MVPVLEPSDAQEALDFTRTAFDLSERFDTPVILRSTTRLSHARSLVRVGEREEHPPRGFIEDPTKNVMLPAYARLRHPLLIEREAKLRAWLETSDLMRWEPGRTDFGVITLGPSYTYVKEVAPGASVLKLGVSHPLPAELIRRFCASVEQVLVVEELEPVVELELRSLGLAVEGKRYFPRVGELSSEIVRAGLVEAGALPKDLSPPRGEAEPDAAEPLARPPVLCPGCPHVSPFMALRALGARVAGDIGCYTLSALEPLRSIDTTVAMGCSIGNAVGLAKSGGESRPIVATIGDSTFLHAGIPPLIDAVYNRANIAVLVLDNHTIAMTGGQDHPGTGRTLRGEETHRVDLEQLIRSLGVPWVRKVDSYELAQVYQTVREATQFEGVAVVILDRPCTLDPVELKGAPFEVIDEGCTACQACMNLGCPSIVWGESTFEGHHRVRIDAATCIGCSLCVQLCPTGCIRPVAV
jgi:indolepyruvate ferredoxin oxidoreductase alpha subunit